MRAHHVGRLGKFYRKRIEEFLESERCADLKGTVNLIFTSPPFPLNRKKEYGNYSGAEYLEWLSGLAKPFADLLAEDGSIVIELGNSWEPGRPVQSLLHLRSLLSFLEAPGAGLRLCQQLICYNPARLPSPAQWVTVERIRLTDSFTHVWWMSKTDFPKADNSKVLRPYSRSMRDLLKTGDYNSGARPSGFVVGEDSFLTDNDGSIPQNVFELEAMEKHREVRLPNVMAFANTTSNDYFLRECRERGVIPHPARMAPELAAFFIQFLTDPGDLILDPFAGSNTTGYVAERLGRRWISVDPEKEYARQSKIRMADPKLTQVENKGS